MTANRHPTEELGRHVRQARERAGLSVRGLASLAKVDSSWLSRLERGDYASPDPRHLRALAQVLHLDTADLFIAAGYRGSEGLPGFAPYLRAKYDLSPEEVAQLQAHFELVNERHASQ